MRTRNSPAGISGDDDTTTTTAAIAINDNQQQQPLLPPRTTLQQPARSLQQGRRPPPPPPPLAPTADRQITAATTASQQQQQQPTVVVTTQQQQHQRNVSKTATTTSPQQQSPTRISYQQQQQQQQLSPPQRLLPHPQSISSPRQQQQQQQQQQSTEPIRTAGIEPLVHPIVAAQLPPQQQGQPATDVTENRIATQQIMEPPPRRDMPVITVEAAEEEEPSWNWILQVRLPPIPSPATTNGSTVQPQRPIRKIQMTTHGTMDVPTLSNCLQQCCGFNNYSYSTNTPNGNCNNINSTTAATNIAGLFSETTQTFYSLQHILSWDNHTIRNEQRQHHVYAIEMPLPVPPTESNDDDGHPEQYGFWNGWYYFVVDALSSLYHMIVSHLYILIPIILAIVLYHQFAMVSDSITYTYMTMYNTMIEQPLRELYRYGPWFIGWEGDDISSICARITYHGDTQFWLRNTMECHRIYTTKETAFIRISVPFIYVLLGIVSIYIIRFLLQEYQQYQFQLHQNHRNPLERDMADLYNSFHVILRQILQVHNTNNYNINPPQQQRQQQHRGPQQQRPK